MSFRIRGQFIPTESLTLMEASHFGKATSLAEWKKNTLETKCKYKYRHLRWEIVFLQCTWRHALNWWWWWWRWRRRRRRKLYRYLLDHMLENLWSTWSCMCVSELMNGLSEPSVTMLNVHSFRILFSISHIILFQRLVFHSTFTNWRHGVVRIV